MVEDDIKKKITSKMSRKITKYALNRQFGRVGSRHLGQSSNLSTVWRG